MLNAVWVTRNYCRKCRDCRTIIYTSITGRSTVPTMVKGSTRTSSCNTLSCSWSCFFACTSLGDSGCTTGSATALIWKQTGASGIDSGSFVIISRTIVEACVGVIGICDACNGGARWADASRSAPVHSIASCSAYIIPVQFVLIISSGYTVRVVRWTCRWIEGTGTGTGRGFLFFATGEDGKTKKGNENYV